MSNKETGLMKKTKAQLVEIILRKDDEEIRLKNFYEAAKKDAEEKDRNIKHLTDSLNEANRNVEHYKSGMDELTSQKAEAYEVAKKFEKERNAAYGWNWALATTIVIVTTLWILL